MAEALAAMAYRPHVALAPRAAAAAAAASRPRLVGRSRRAPAGRSLALRVDMRAEGGRLRRMEDGVWRRVEEEGPGQEGGGAGAGAGRGTRGRDQSRGNTQASRGGGRGVSGSGSGSPTRRAPAPSRHAPGSAGSSNKQLNSRISGAGSVVEILELVEQHHKSFDFIHVATAVTRVAKLAKEQRRFGGSCAESQDVPLASDERYARLMGLVVQQLPSFMAQAVANVFFGLATLQVECGVAADTDLLVKLGAAVERVAPDMKPQAVGNTQSDKI